MNSVKVAQYCINNSFYLRRQPTPPYANPSAGLCGYRMQASGLRGGSERAPPIAASYSAISGTGGESAARK